MGYEVRARVRIRGDLVVAWIVVHSAAASTHGGRVEVRVGQG